MGTSKTNHAVFAPQAHGRPVVGLSIGAARPEHAPEIARVEVAGEGGDPQAMIPSIAGELARIARGEVRRYTCLALVDGEVVAYARCGYREADVDYPEMPEGWYLLGIHVLGGYRRRGIGRALTAHRMAWLARRTQVVHYSTAMENHSSVALHTEFGFVERATAVRTRGYRGRQPGRWFESRALPDA